MEKQIPTLHTYQKQLVSNILEKPRLALFVEMGLGKTLTMLTAINTLLGEKKVRKVLVIAPLAVYENTWVAELQLWAGLDNINFKTLSYTPLKLRAQLLSQVFASDVNLVISSSSMIRTTARLMKELSEFDMLVVDESTEFKSHSSRRFQELKNILHFFKRRYILTGTPISNTYMDLWSQIYILDEGERLGKNITAYRNKYFRCTNTSYYTYTLLPSSIPLIQDSIKDIVVSLTNVWLMQKRAKLDKAKRALKQTNAADKQSDRPGFHSIIEYIELPDHQKSIYNKLRRQMYLQLFNGYFYDSNIHIRCASAADVTNKLLQFSSGSVYTDDGKYLVAHNCKFYGLRNIIEKHKGENVLVVYNYKHEGERIQTEFAEAIQLTKDNINDWNTNKIKLGFFQVATLSRGVNLQHGGHIIVWFGFTWALELYQQANARLYRQGQQHNVYCYHLCCTPIERRLLETLSKKEATQRDLLECLKLDKES